MTEKPWRARHFNGGYSAEFLPCGMSVWRILRKGGKPRVFPTISAARDAAQNAYLASVEGNVRATVQVDPERIAAKMQAEAESWLKSKREDVRRAEIVRRPGRRVLTVVRGRA